MGKNNRTGEQNGQMEQTGCVGRFPFVSSGNRKPNMGQALGKAQGKKEMNRMQPLSSTTSQFSTRQNQKQNSQCLFISLMTMMP